MQPIHFIVGSKDPEMDLIKELIWTAKEVGMKGVAGLSHATCRGNPVHSGNAHLADGTDTRPGRGTRAVFVECRVKHVRSVRVIDHHRPGDPGFDCPPEQYWEGSSLGQTVSFLEQIATRAELEKLHQALSSRWDDMRMAAAADHCLGSAYQGRCPGVDPLALRYWRVISKSRYRSECPAAILAKVQHATSWLKTADRFTLNDERVALVPEEVPELPEASAILGTPVEYLLEDKRTGRTKIGLLNASVHTIREWMSKRAPLLGLDDIYGSPMRGYAGGYR